MTYLTRIQGIRGDDYRVHQLLKSIFDGDKILFQRGRFETTVLSTKAPGLGAQEFGAKEISAFLDGIETGSEFSFTARVNPVVTKIDKKGKRYPVAPDKLQEWIDRKLDDAAMAAEFTYCTEGPRISNKNGHKITLSSVFVTGMCQVKDANWFKTALIRGIGHSKGLGFGMINIFADL
jgi:CRISPR-associated protein Cas6/Cse3/CasE subtype I-E